MMLSTSMPEFIENPTYPRTQDWKKKKKRLNIYITGT